MSNGDLNYIFIDNMSYLVSYLYESLVNNGDSNHIFNSQRELPSIHTILQLKIWIIQHHSSIGIVILQYDKMQWI